MNKLPAYVHATALAPTRTHTPTTRTLRARPAGHMAQPRMARASCHISRRTKGNKTWLPREAEKNLLARGGNSWRGRADSPWDVANVAAPFSSTHVGYSGHAMQRCRILLPTPPAFGTLAPRLHACDRHYSPRCGDTGSLPDTTFANATTPTFGRRSPTIRCRLLLLALRSDYHPTGFATLRFSFRLRMTPHGTGRICINTRTTQPFCQHYLNTCSALYVRTGTSFPTPCHYTPHTS